MQPAQKSCAIQWALINSFNNFSHLYFAALNSLNAHVLVIFIWIFLHATSKLMKSIDTTAMEERKGLLNLVHSSEVNHFIKWIFLLLILHSIKITEEAFFICYGEKFSYYRTSSQLKQQGNFLGEKNFVNFPPPQFVLHDKATWRKTSCFFSPRESKIHGTK